METQDDFFSPKHKRLLNIATWAKWLAWAMLILTIINYGIIAIARFLQFPMTPNQSQPITSFLNFFELSPTFWIDLIADTILGMLKAVIYFLVLKGISLGLNMIVETDINYREKSIVEGDND
ncbi:MAG: hypothetical protein ACOYZ6_07505 [Chloroflexota bacterium]